MNLRLVEENDKCRYFVCLACLKEWFVSRSKVKQQAREDHRLNNIRKISDLERQKVSVSGPYYMGPKHA